MKRLFFCVVIFVLLFIFGQNSCQCTNLSKRQDIFTPSFQLVWLDLKDLISTKKINFTGIDPQVVRVLNSNNFGISDVDNDCFYKIVAKKSFELKAKIMREIYDKFNETSNVLSEIDWTPKGYNDYILYSLFKKDVEFTKEFKILSSAPFNKSKQKYKLFGFYGSEASEYKNQVRPLFYNYDWDYAVSIDTINGDRIILFRTDSKQNVYDLYSQVLKKSTKEHFLGDSDKLIIPFISLCEKIEYKQIADRRINNSRLVISKAIDDVQFNLDNKGAKLRNESVINAVEMSLPIPGRGKSYDFTKPFILFMIENGKSNPYFALRVSNTDYLVRDASDSSN